ncbi:MAG: helix-turn-helix domain-containing protein [Oscillospiraceae bacterium]|jgi:transcriptional regulator with XRE-family HTH domain|nr:helix-turn-helix domain-containing protein [Oscillospiraceae bacterium]
MNDEMTFGAFIRDKRLKRNISLRYLVELLDLSPVHLSNIENDRRPAPKDEVLKRIIEVLQLNKQEQIEMYELAAKSKDIPTVPGDLPEYISANELARVALRTAKDVDATDNEWIEFIEKLRKRSKEEE